MTERDDPFEGVPEPLRQAIQERGFHGLTAVQRAVLDALDAAEDEPAADATDPPKPRPKNLRISSQTGSGKTVAIGLALAPALLELAAEGARGQPRVLLIAPTRELAAQVEAELSWLFAGLQGIETCVVTGGTDPQRERQALRRGPTIVVGTPGRILDHIRGGALRTQGLGHVVLDEADHMLDMGFKDELDAITDALPPERCSHLVSATFPRAVLRFADRFQPQAIHLEGTRLGEANADIEHLAYLVEERDHYAALVNLMLITGGERCLVFVRRRVETAELAERLAADGFSALPFSGDLPQAQRNRTLHAFRNDVVRILVATDVAARGIDVADIATVVHVEPPADAETYTHRSGRTGRAGQRGQSILLVPPRAERRLRRLFHGSGIAVNWSALPGPKSIDKALKKRARRRIHAAMDQAEALPPAALEYAQELLGRYDPATLVARLVDLARPSLPRPPMPYARPVSRDGDGPRQGPDQGQDPGYGRRPSRGDPRFTAFRIAFGARDGASPARLLATVCRRGAVSGRQVGAIRIGEEESAFEVDAAVADAFLERASAEGQGEGQGPGRGGGEPVIEPIDALPERGPRARRRGPPGPRGARHGERWSGPPPRKRR